MSAPSPEIHITRMKKAGLALLSKRITLGADGRPASDGSRCAMTNGTASRVTLDWWLPATNLAALISDLGSHEALVLGDHVAKIEAIEIVKAAHAAPTEGRYGRTLETFKYNDGCPAAGLLDFDRKGMSDAARATLEQYNGFEGALAHLIPGYADLARVVRASTSAGLHNTETREMFPGSGGVHVYVFAADGADIPRFLRDLQRRAWLAGLGWIVVGARGALLVRSIVDAMVGSPERLVFEGAPVIEPPLAQDAVARRPVAHEGSFLDTLAACPPLTPEEERACDTLIAAAKLEKRPEVEAAKERGAEEIATLRGITIEKARAVIEASTQGELWSWDVLQFDDEAIGEVAVADVLADPERLHGETLVDPLEGRSYGRGKAQLYWNANNTVVINSFAHGGCVYRVHHDSDYIEQKVEDAGEDAPFVLATLMAHAGKIDAVTRERLRDLAAKLGRVGKRAVAQAIKETAREAKRSAAAAARARGDRGKGAAKPSREELILIGGERPAQLCTIETKLRMPANVIPGTVVARGQATAAIRCEVDPVKLRAGKQEIDLPAGSAYLTVARPEHLQAQLDDLFAFRKVNKEGEQYPVDCPPDLARYVLANANLLPVQYISRTPVLRADGSILDRPGYDLTTAIFYAPDEVFPPVPSNPSQKDARAALDRLRHPFRAFPFVGDTDRDAVVGEILTLITRHLVPRAPAFVHNAVEAGSGKTKLFDTVAIIAIGTNVPLLNADILDDETELKKVLTTLTLAATPLTVFDNVVRGGQITSPGLSNYLTATVYGDRLLGSNTEVKAATCTVVGMTGNAVEIAGDNTRRMLRIDLDAAVERPETRVFDFDCEAEARRHRGELVAAALTVLRAHALAGRPPVPGRAALGSFEDWDRLVAGTIVFAGGADIVTLLDKTRETDPERDDLAEVLRMLKAVGATEPMKAGEIIRAVEQAKTDGEDVLRPADEWHAILCRLSRDGQPNARKIGRSLTKNAGRIAGGLQLVSTVDAHAKVTRYYVRPPLDARSAGFAEFCGVSPSPFQRRGVNIESQDGVKLKESHIDGLAQTPQNSANPAISHPPPNGVGRMSHHNGADIGPCAHCRQDISPGALYTATSSGAHLHNTCVDAWARGA